MEEIVFSVITHGPAAMDRLQKLLKRFEDQNGIRVRLEIAQSWALGWSKLVETALYRSGPDISEAGNTWVGDLARMEALHPFKLEQVIEITEAARLFESVWMTRIRDEAGVPTIYSIPWTGDTRAVFYRRDLLAKAGIDESTGFIDIHHFDNTLATLKETGLLMPLAITTRRSSLTIHNIATWVWAAGGEFLSSDESGLAFDRPQSVAGCTAYFRLARYLGCEPLNLGESDAAQAFRTGTAAVTMSGYWMVDVGELSEEVRKNLGVVSMPGTPFVGGHDLVMWNHSHHKPAVIKLIQYLHSEEANRELYPLYGLPVSESAWENPPFDTGFYPIFKNGIQNGRGFRGNLWGLVEKRLTDEYADIWNEILKSPEDQLDSIVLAHLKNLSGRLQLSVQL